MAGRNWEKFLASAKNGVLVGPPFGAEYGGFYVDHDEYIY